MDIVPGKLSLSLSLSFSLSFSLSLARALSVSRSLFLSLSLSLSLSFSLSRARSLSALSVLCKHLFHMVLLNTFQLLLCQFGSNPRTAAAYYRMCSLPVECALLP